jgi:lysophospholipase L1-like esterase
VPGYTSHQGLAWLRRDIARYSPDVVTACFGWNDINHRARTDRQTMSTSPLAVAARFLLSKSQVSIRLGLLAREMAPLGGPTLEEATTMRVPRDEYVQNLLAIADVAREYGAAPVFIGPVYRDRSAHPPEGDEIALHRDALRSAAVAHKIPYLEIAALLEDAHPQNAQLFEEHIHPNAKGHRLMAESLLMLLAQRELLKDLRVEVPRPGVGFKLGQQSGR